MKSIKLFLIAITLTLVFRPITANAQKPTKGELKAEKAEIKVEKKETKSTTGLFKNKGVKLIGTQVTIVSGNTLIVSKDGNTFTVNTYSNTRFRRRFWGKSAISEISVGDSVNIWGKWADDAKTTITAAMIRNLSIMKRKGVFVGSVKSKDTANFIITTINRGDQTVNFDTKTKIVGRNNKPVAYSDMNVGDRVRVKGLWDKKLSKITEVTQVKNYSLPVKATPTPKS